VIKNAILDERIQTGSPVAWLKNQPADARPGAAETDGPNCCGNFHPWSSGSNTNIRKWVLFAQLGKGLAFMVVPRSGLRPNL
jgi:hypothetical protein